MNYQIRDAWVRALRSGDYVQGTNVLRRDTAHGPEFCCLGGWCELAVKAGVISSEKMTDRGEPVTYYDGNNTTLPLSVMRWAGLDDECGLWVEIDHVYANLAVQNDEERATFDQIADAIEEYL